MTFDVMNRNKGFGRGWGHPRSHKTNEKVRMPQKPEYNKNYKLKRDSKKYTDSQLLGAPYTEVVEVVCMNECTWESDKRSECCVNELERDEEESMHTFM